MQRRTAKSSAHIAPPTPGLPPSSVGGALEKPPSSLNQRTLGLPNRIWLIVSLFLAILFFTRLILPSNSSDTNYYFRHHSSSYAAGLHPTNYLNASDEQAANPFDFCPTFGQGDDLSEKYGALTIAKSWLHLGSGARVQQVVHKALLGQPVTISVIGGSVSSCHGAGDDPIAPECYPTRFFAWWNSLFPHPASELTNGAMRRTNSEYFSFCNAHHLPDYTDLVIIELDTDDKSDRQTLDNFELLVRSILLRPDAPAVIILGHFAPQTHQQNGFAGPDHWHSIVAQFYDVPHISAKAAIYPSYMARPSSVQHYFTDPVLANGAGHGVLADMLIAYVQSQVCLAWTASRGGGAALPMYYALGGGAGGGVRPGTPKDATGLFGGKGLRKGDSGEEEEQRRSVGTPLQHLQVPHSRISSLPEDLVERPFEEVAPACVSANDLINPLPPSLFYGTGWHAYHPPSPTAPGSSSAHYWYSTLPGSKLRIPLNVGAGDIGVYYVRESRDVLGDEGGSAVECWVDDNYAGKVLIDNEGEGGEAEPILQIIDHYVARGSHYVECQLVGEEGHGVPPFKIIGVFTT
ncbi:hypothetical protein FA95DRAFT_1528711 [Auriscalpium vulgare]|uniref:Uncharacterized protein n=1 Tax=Auriscalpium vulgare TaxID=40419 RepID=A0ACB8R4W6_9AGAM|nr:hypothetical protein FA95DRAFT_1528711 [Auriscalpium vulgare]